MKDRRTWTVERELRAPGGCPNDFYHKGKKVWRGQSEGKLMTG